MWDDSSNDDDDHGDSLTQPPCLRECFNPPFVLVFQAARLVYEMRHKWQNLFIKKMRFPSKPWSQQDEAIIHAVVSVGFAPAPPHLSLAC